MLGTWLRWAVMALGAWLPGALAHADNAALQTLFFAACQNPTGTLAERCGETDGAAGDLSGDSESSLNPSQSLSSSGVALRGLFGRAEDTSRADTRTGTTDDGVRLEFGRLSLLTSFSRTWEDRDRTVDLDSERAYDADTEVGEIGMDYRLSDSAVIGLLLDYRRFQVDFVRELPGESFSPASSAGRIESDSIGVAAYASLVVGQRGYLDLGLGYQRGENDYQRNSIFQESGRQAPQTLSVVTGSADTEEAWASVNGGWQLARDAWTYGLHGGLTLTDSQIDGFEERDRSGAGLAMRFSKADQRSLVGAVGVHVQRAVGTGWGVLVPYGRAAYSHEFDDDPVSLRTAYLLDADGNVLELEGDEPDRNFVTLALGVSAVLPNGWIPYLDVSYWAGYEDLDHVRLQAGLRKEL